MKRWLWLLTLLFTSLLLLRSHVVTHAKSTLSDIPDRLVTLTFDDGPDPRFTPTVLKLLQAHHAPGTFFLVGRNALAHPDLVKAIESQGDVIGNHTMTHPHLEKMNAAQIDAELNADDAALSQIIGTTSPVPHFFRPPRGEVTPAITKEAARLNKELVLWNVCVENHTTTTPEAVTKRVVKLIDDRNGGILLAHDGELDRSLTMRALPLILTALEKQGYHFVPLSTYLKARDDQKARSL
ncbi:MAG: polysaccharide deacetylase family protein [Tumebacillaceae bacterium]